MAPPDHPLERLLDEARIDPSPRLESALRSSSLRYFSEVVRCGSFRRAAEVLHIAPSAISRQIAQLEYRLKAPLFERHTNRLVLTEEGRILAEHVHVLDASTHRLATAIDDISKLRRGHVRVASVEAMAPTVLPKAIAAFQARHPNLTVKAEIMGTDAIVEAVIRDEVDLGIAFCPEEREEVVVLADFAHPLHVITSASNPLGKASGVALADLSEFRVALPVESFGIRRLIESVAQRRPVRLLRIFESNSIELIKGMVRHSATISFLPTSAVFTDLALGVLRAVPMKDVEFSSTRIQVLAMKGRVLSRAAEALLSEFKEVGASALADTDRKDQGAPT